MNVTNISNTIRAQIGREEGTALAYANARDIPPSTLNRLLNQQQRVDPETLKTLCTHHDKNGIEILIAHLRDEIDRSGRLQSEIQIDAAAPTDDDWTLLQRESQTNHDLRAIVADMARLIRRHQAHTLTMMAESEADEQVRRNESKKKKNARA